VNKKFNYKAYISYSHCDERWASWLHRALEAYRVPRKLVGTRTDAGEVPARIRPVFRDRDDLSSAHDLGGTVKKALTDSENMIVICSPDAAASHWVNEEIREFASLGRAKQIFCVIVDGEPGGIGTVSTCFPAALAEIGLQEPLAADVRKWADGKLLSKLKLVAGMLGLPLDQLRRRDLQKRQRIWVMAAIASIAVAAVLVTAITFRIAAQQRRISGESLVAYKLNEMRSMLNVADDPEDLVRLNEWSQQDLGRLIGYAGVGQNALLNSALELRSQGGDLYQKGALSEALDQYQQSWALIAESYRRDRSDQAVFFELGQAEFYMGQIYTDQGEFDKAEYAFMSYAEITRRLIQLQPENADWVLEMAYALNNLGILQRGRDANNPERVLQLMQSALEYNQIALVLDPENAYYLSELGQSHAFLADAQRDVCDLEGALQSRQKNVSLEREALSLDSENIGKIKKLAWALSGYSVVQEETGQTDGALQSVETALQLMGPVLADNPESNQLSRYILYHKSRVIMLKALSGSGEQAWLAMEALDKEWQTYFQRARIEGSDIDMYITFLLGRASLAMSLNKSEIAGQLLQETIAEVVKMLEKYPANRSAENLLVRAVFQRWELTRAFAAEAVASLLPDYRVERRRSRACQDANAAVRQAIMLGDTEWAGELTTYLLDKGYRESGFMQICKAYSLCAGQQRVN